MPSQTHYYYSKSEKLSWNDFESLRFSVVLVLPNWSSYWLVYSFADIIFYLFDKVNHDSYVELRRYNDANNIK